MYCIETNNLTYRFSKKETILNNICLQVPEGSIYGFLGPNGAGKTTTLRLLLGLLKQQEGTIHLFNQSLAKHRVELLKRTGSLIESPSLYAHLTAMENLRVLQKIYQCPAARIKEVLHLVGLSATGDKKAGKFSLGMKQRLSIAMALLPAPSLLILDEPTNGLDPNGIIEIRELLKKLNRELRLTIVISSHLLPEIEKLVTHTGIIHKGQLMFQGTLEELVNKQQQADSLLLATDNEEITLRILRDQTLAARCENGKILLPLVSKEARARLNQQLVQSGVGVYEMTPVKNDLEAIFMNLINN